MKNYSLLIIALLTFLSLKAQTKFPVDKMETVANAYFKAYAEMNFEKMSNLYHNDIEFEDNTYVDNAGNGAYLKGKETIKKTFSNSYFPNVEKGVFKEEERFFSGTQGIFRGVFITYIKGSVAGKSDDKTFVSTTPFVMVLTFKMEGDTVKIIHHTDYANYKKTDRKWEGSK